MRWIKNKLRTWRIRKLKNDLEFTRSLLKYHRSAIGELEADINKLYIKLNRLNPDLEKFSMPKMQKREGFTVIIPSDFTQQRKLE